MGFIALDAATGTVRWPELVGNGMLKTAGNVRATGTATLLVLDVASGDAYELTGRGEYRTVLRYDEPRERGLWPSMEHFPSQGEMTLHVTQAYRLEGLINPAPAPDRRGEGHVVLAGRGPGPALGGVWRFSTALSRPTASACTSPRRGRGRSSCCVTASRSSGTRGAISSPPSQTPAITLSRRTCEATARLTSPTRSTSTRSSI